MCGINGCVPPSKNISLMNNALRHRGPDGSGEYTDSFVSLGQRRLSILDLSEHASQPMGLFSDGSISHKNLENADYIIVYNGEVYNYQEIKKELHITNISTTGDTGILLHAYKRWGPDFVNKLNGMWAICIYDKEKQELFLSRDRLGQKPLYYYYDKKQFIFSSELKAIKQVKQKLPLDKESVDLYFSLGFIPSPKSIYEQVYKLEQGHNIVYSLKNKTIKKTKYYSYPLKKKNLSAKEVKEKYHELMESAVNYRLISDVPVGAFLSGGIDSSSVVAYIKKKNTCHTFSIGFEGEKYDETPYINIVKNHFNTIHHHQYYTKKDFVEDIKKYSEVYDEPFGDYSGFPTLKVSELAREHVTVALSGDGGDEIFGGYPWHILGNRIEIIRKIPRFIRKIISTIPMKTNLDSTASLGLFIQACKLSLLPKEEFYAKSLTSELFKPTIYQKWSSKHLKTCLELSQNNLGEALRLYDLHFHTLADNFLTKVDRASMYWSLEVRSPYLDYRMVEFAQEIKPSLKSDLFSGKKILKKSLVGILPHQILYRKKQGFTPPIDSWIMDSEFKTYLRSTNRKLKEISPEAHKFFKEKAFVKNYRPYRVYLIRLYLFGKWLERWE